MQSMDEVTARAERSASTSSDMAQIAQKAAEDARLAAESLQGAVAEASERIRTEASEGAELHVSQVQAAGERLRSDLQGHVDEMISRIEQASGSRDEATAAAEIATNAAREAADRVQQSVAAVEAAVANAQRAADEARAAAERSESSAGSISEAVSAAQEAAQASREAASQAGTQSSVLGGEANMLLERLETDYDLLTRLVRELHGRIAALSLPSVPSAPAAPEPAMPEPAMPELETQDIEGPVASFEPLAAEQVPAAELDAPADAGWATVAEENAGWQAPEVTEPELVPEAPMEQEATYWAYDENAWEAPASEAHSEPEAMVEAEAETQSAYWPQPVEETAVWQPQTPETEPEAVAEAPVEAEPVSWSQAAEENTAWNMPASEVEASAEAEVTEVVSEETAPEAWVPEPVVEEAPAPVDVTVRGRVQVRIAPVPDFDRLLNLDGALGRVSGVDSVTLADYAQEEVTFRVEILGEKDAGLFTRELAVSAGVDATLVDAVDNGLIVRIN
jgi:hypothetical protein